eukprot:5073962-Lingulodinium_polyedra.AAC.1
MTLISTLGHYYTRQGIQTASDLAEHLGEGIVPYGPLQRDIWQRSTNRAGVWAQLEGYLSLHRRRLRDTAPER